MPGYGSYEEATRKKARKQDGGKTRRAGKFKCRLCRGVRGTQCGFDGKQYRFHMMNRHCETLESLKQAFKTVGAAVIDGERTGYFSYYYAEVDGVLAFGIWKHMFERFLCAFEVKDGEAKPMRLKTAEALLEKSKRHYSQAYEDGGV